MKANEKVYDIYNGELSKDEVPGLLMWITPGSRVLELGAATGYMTKYLKEVLDCRVTSIEINPEMAQKAEMYTEKMIVADLDTGNWEEQLTGKYDFVVCGDVLEHLRYPQETLKKLTRFIHPEGSVLTSIPNMAYGAVIMCLMDGEFEYQQYGLLDDSHIHFFTRKSIKKMMDACGLMCVDENNRIIRPGISELKKFFITHPSSYLSVFGQEDMHIYQFISRWTFRENPLEKKQFSGTKLKCSKKILLFFDDINDYVSFRFGVKFCLPIFMRRLVRR